MTENSIVGSAKPMEEPRSLFWTIILYAGAMLLIPCALFVSLDYWLAVTLALILLNVLLVGLLYIGMKRHEKVKDKDVSATTFSRKMFNIIAGLLFAFFTWFFLLFNAPWMGFFVLLAVDYAFGIHEVIYVIFKTKTYFTDAFIALGRQSEPFKPYLASIMALFAFTIVLGFQMLVFQLIGIPNFEWVVITVYVATVVIWGIGDTAAYFVGTKFGKNKLPWNPKKSWQGFFANFAVGIGIGLIAFSPFLLPFVSTVWWILLAIIGAFSAAFFESANLRLDDNFVTVVCTGIILALLIIAI